MLSTRDVRSGNHSIIMDDSAIEVGRKPVRSMIGKESKMVNANGLLPKHERLAV